MVAPDVGLLEVAWIDEELRHVQLEAHADRDQVLKAAVAGAKMQLANPTALRPTVRVAPASELLLHGSTKRDI